MSSTRQSSIGRPTSERAYVALVEMIYAATGDSSLWPSVLERLTESVRSRSASITIEDRRQPVQSIEWSFGVENRVADDYARYYAQKNIYLEAGLPAMQTGALLVGGDFVPDALALKSEFYNDFMRPMGVFHHAVGCLYRDGAVAALLHLPRPIGAPTYSTAELDFCRRIIPHMQRAVAIHRQIVNADIRLSASDAAMDCLPIGIVITSGDGSPVYANHSAREVLEAQDGLRLTPNGFIVDNARDGAELRKQLRSAANAAALERGPVVVQITRRSARAPYAVLVSRARHRRLTLGSGDCRLVVFIHDPAKHPVAWDTLLQQLYNLTPAETRVVSLLVRGHRLDQVCDQLAVTANTARTHLKRAFAKTGARSQSDLIRILLTGPAQLRGAPLERVDR
jgi:DNA-binding CsgD family transcriptional regulator/PAS domain-containing protein